MVETPGFLEGVLGTSSSAFLLRKFEKESDCGTHLAGGRGSHLEMGLREVDEQRRVEPRSDARETETGLGEGC